MLKLLLIASLLLTSLFAETGKVYSVADGDTFTLINDGKYTKCRFDYYDTPEVYMTNKMAWDSYHCNRSTKDINTLGTQSSAFLKNTFKIGTIINYKIIGWDDSGRALIVVDDFHKTMIKEGYAHVSKFHKTDSELLGLMNYAKENKLGLWSVDYQLMECLSTKAIN